jgi:hypothetical protein
VNDVLQSVAFFAVIAIGMPAVYLIGRWHGKQSAAPVFRLSEFGCVSRSPELLDGRTVPCMRHYGHPGWHEGPERGPNAPVQWLYDPMYGRPSDAGPRPTEETG